VGTARWKGVAGNRGRPAQVAASAANATVSVAARAGVGEGRSTVHAEHDFVMTKPGNAGGGKGPCFWCAFEAVEDRGIGGEPGNTRTDPDTAEKALSQGEGGAGVPLLSALRQGLARGHSRPRLCARPCERGCAGCGRGDVCRDRGGRAGRVARRFARRVAREDVSTTSGATGDDPEARWRRAATGHPDDTGSCRRRASSTTWCRPPSRW
jgi:hypothetical protein